MSGFLFRVLWLSLVTGAIARADGGNSSEAEVKILNFEDQYIHGRGIAPEVLLQLGRSPKFMDEVIYLRKDFNDFHQFDLKTRPRFIRRQ